MLDAGLFNAINEAYADLDLGNDHTQYKFIEIQADNLSDAALRQAITDAGTTTQDDIIVLHTTATQNKITLGGTELLININAEQWGSVTIVSLGEMPLTIDANQESGVLSIGGNTVALAGLTITGGFSDYGGGGIGVGGSNVKLTITQCIISGNTANGQGGGIYSEISGSNPGATAGLTIRLVA